MHLAKQQGAKLPFFAFGMMPGKANELSWVAVANLGDFLIGFFISPVLNGEDNTYVDAPLFHMPQGQLGVIEGVPGIRKVPRVPPILATPAWT